MEKLNPGKIRRKERKHPGRVREAYRQARQYLNECFENFNYTFEAEVPFDIALAPEYTTLPDAVKVGQIVLIDWLSRQYRAEILSVEVLDSNPPIKVRINAREIPKTSGDWVKVGMQL